VGPQTASASAAPQARTFLLPDDETPLFRWLRRFIIVTATAYAMLFSWGIYRRLIQVQRIDLPVPSSPIGPGSAIAYDVVTSGEVHNLIRLEVLQGDRRSVLHEQWSGVNHVNTLDPRLFRYRPTIAIAPRALDGFRPGPATLRLTVFGNQKLLRTPAPRTREVGVVLLSPAP
jgi:hypothetical protein